MHGDVSTVYVIDDDLEARINAMGLAISMGLNCQGFSTASDFLASIDPSRAGCAVVDLCLPDLSGLQLLERLRVMRSSLSVVMIGAFADVTAVVQSMQHGAVTFIEKPCRNDCLERAVREALEYSRILSMRQAFCDELTERLRGLTTRERLVMNEVLEDKPNRTIAKELSISVRTVARSRAAVFDKLGVYSATELARRIAEREMYEMGGLSNGKRASQEG